MTIWTPGFWKATAERVIATALGALLAILLTDGVNLMTVAWKGALLSIGTQCAISLVKAVLANLVTKNGPSATNSEQVVPPEPQPVN